MHRFAWFFLAVPLLAQFRSIDIAVSGLDCAACAESVAKRLQRIRGVESAAFAVETSTAVVRLKPDNTVPLETIRDGLKGLGYTPGTAKVTVRGQAVQADGKWRFRPGGGEREYVLAIPAGTQVREGTPLIVEGTIESPADRAAPEALKASAIRAE